MTERIFRFNGAVLEELPARRPGRRYKYRAHPLIPSELIYLEFSDAEEAARDAEEATPPPPFSGLGFVRVQRPNQSISNNVALAELVFNAPADQSRGIYWIAGQADRLTIPANQGGLYELRAQVRFQDASQQAGIRQAVIRIGENGSAVNIAERRPAIVGGTEFGFSEIEEITGGTIVRLMLSQNSGSAMTCGGRLILRRIE